MAIVNLLDWGLCVSPVVWNPRAEVAGLMGLSDNRGLESDSQTGSKCLRRSGTVASRGPFCGC